jgi:hypothetical protein
LALGVVLGTGIDVRRGNHMNRGRVGEERGGKETDRYPLTHVDSMVPFCFPFSMVEAWVSWEGVGIGRVGS